MINYIFYLLSIEKFEALRNVFYQQDRDIVIFIIKGRQKVILIHGGRQKVIWAGGQRKVNGTEGRGPGQGAVD